MYGEQAVTNDDLAPSIGGFRAAYVTVAGMPTWHEVGGYGAPVVLLHGAFSGAAAWTTQAVALAGAGFEVHVPERRGHAHTPDVPGPLTYEDMALDCIAYLETVVAGKAHLVGRSDGAVVALIVALRRPDLVHHMVLMSKFYNSVGRAPTTDFERWLRSDQGKARLRQAYDPISPDGPEHFDVVYAKTMAMIESGPELDLETLSGVLTPTLVLQADRDVVTLDHGAAVAAALRHGRFAVLPGSHNLPTELPDVVSRLLVAFLSSK